MRSDIKGVLVDCNGTLADTETPWFGAWHEIYATHGLVLTKDYWRKNLQRLWGLQIVDRLQRDLRPLGSSISNSQRLELVRYAKRRAAQLRADISRRTGVESVVFEAIERGFKVGVVSNSPRRYVLHWLSPELRNHLERQPGLIIDKASAGGLGKPSPASYLLGVRRLGLRPKEVLSLDDTPNGVKAAAAAGTFSVAVTSEWALHKQFPIYDLKITEPGSLDSVLAALPSVPVTHRALTRVGSASTGIGL